MGLVDRLWEAVKFLVRIGDRVDRLNERCNAQQKHIETLSERVLRLELLSQISTRPQRATLESIDFSDGSPPA